jgi:ribonuclease BN (tRNA processing enzyme)
VALQVLGSGGPIADDGRASAGYIVWVDGQSRFLIDTGGGTFLRFGEAAASFNQLDFIGISHFHTDHSADFPALMKSGYFSKRDRSLSIAGPDGNDSFPGLESYLHHMLDEKGAYGYLSGYLEGTGSLPLLVRTEVAGPGVFSISGNERSDIQVDAMHVPHGIVPALAYRIRVGELVVVFSSDQNGSDEGFVDFAKNAAVLVMHMPIPEYAEGVALKLHAPPSLIAKIATQSEAKTLLLSHFMARSLQNLDSSVQLIRSNFDGNVVVANDLQCLVIDSE